MKILKRCARPNRHGLVLGEDCAPSFAQLGRSSAHAPCRRAAELVLENARLRDTLRRQQDTCAKHCQDAHELRRIRTRLEQQLAALKCDLHCVHHPPPSVPANPQGKDALFWHQTCRTLQQHTMTLKQELERLRATGRAETGAGLGPEGLEIAPLSQPI